MPKDLFETNTYQKLAEQALGVQVDPDDENSYTARDILSSEPVLQRQYTKLRALQHISRGAISEEDLNSMAEELGTTPDRVIASAKEAYTKPRQTPDDLRNILRYFDNYIRISEEDVVEPKQRIDSIAIEEMTEAPRLTPHPRVNPALARMFDKNVPLSDAQKQTKLETIGRPLTDEEIIVLRLGGDITTTYVQKLYEKGGSRFFKKNKGPLTDEAVRQFFKSDEELAPLLPDKNSPPLVKSFFSLNDPSRQEVKELIQNEDPDAETMYLDPNNPDRGVLIRSELTGGKWVPWGSITGEGFIRSLDTTYRSFGEAVAGPMLDEFSQELLRNLVPELVGGYAGIGLGGLFRQASKRATKESAEKGSEGMITGLKQSGAVENAVEGLIDYGRIAALTGIPVGAIRFATLLYAKESGIHPNLSIVRAAKDAGLSAALAGLGVVGGDVLLRVMQNITRRVTGNNIPEDILQRLKMHAARNQKAPHSTTAEFSQAEIDEILQPYMKDIRRRFSETKTFGDLTQDEVLQEAEAEILKILSAGADERIVIEQMMLGRGVALERFLDNMLAGVDSGQAQQKGFKSVKELREDLESTFKERAIKAKEEALEAEKIAQKDLSAETQVSAAAPTTDVSETIGEQASTSSIFPSTKSTAHIARDGEFQNARNELDIILRSPDNQEVTTTELHKYIGKVIKDALKGGTDSPFKSLEAAETGDIIKEIIPMQEGNSMLKILTGHQARDEAGRFTKATKQEFSLADLVYSRINLGTLRDSPNRQVREYGLQLQAGFDKAITDITKNNPELQEQLIKALTDIDTVYKEAVDGRFLHELVISDNYDKIAKELLSGSPSNVNWVFKYLRDRDSISETIGLREEEVRLAVLDYLRKEIRGGGLDAPELTTLQQNKRFRKIVDEREEQLQAIFPEEQVKKWKNFANFSKSAEASIRASEARISRLQQELINFEADPMGVVTRYLEGRHGVGQNKTTLQQMTELSKLADEYPPLRQNLQETFVTYLQNQLKKSDWGEFDEGFRLIQDSAFDISRLSSPGGTGILDKHGPGAQGTKETANFLKLVLGEQPANEYAKNLRIFKREFSQFKGDEAKRGLLAGKMKSLEDTTAALKLWQRFLVSPLSVGSRRLTASFKILGKNTERNLLTILSDPAKLKQIIELKDKQMKFREYARLIGLIATNPSSEVGGFLKDEPVDKSLRFYKTTMPSFMEGEEAEEDVPELASGGSVAAALQRAEARTRHVQRGR